MDNISGYYSVRELLKELQRLIVALKNDPGNISQLELDLMKGKIRDIYDILSDININKVAEKPMESGTTPGHEPESEPAWETKRTPEPVPEPDKDAGKEEQADIEHSATDDKKERVKQPSSTGPVLNLFEEELSNNQPDDKKPVGEKIAGEKPVESIGEVIQSKKIDSLKLAIGINEKFFFLNELFEGNMKEYSDTIDALDQKETYKDAMEYLAVLLAEKNWDEESGAYNQLKGFLERKFN